jgi:hypothetical protein
MFFNFPKSGKITRFICFLPLLEKNHQVVKIFHKQKKSFFGHHNHLIRALGLCRRGAYFGNTPTPQGLPYTKTSLGLALLI